MLAIIRQYYRLMNINGEHCYYYHKIYDTLKLTSLSAKASEEESLKAYMELGREEEGYNTRRRGLGSQFHAVGPTQAMLLNWDIRER